METSKTGFLKIEIVSGSGLIQLTAEKVLDKVTERFEFMCGSEEIEKLEEIKLVFNIVKSIDKLAKTAKIELIPND